MDNSEIMKIKEPLQQRLAKAYGQLAGLEKEIRKGSKKGDLNLVIKSEAEVSQLRGKLNGLIANDLELNVSQLNERLNEILKKFQQEDYFLTF